MIEVIECLLSDKAYQAAFRGEHKCNDTAMINSGAGRGYPAQWDLANLNATGEFGMKNKGHIELVLIDQFGRLI